MGYGMNGHCGFAFESSGGTPVAAADYIEALSESLTLNKDRFEVKNIVNRFSEADDMAGLDRVGGDIVFAGIPGPLGAMLAGVTGIQSNTEVLSGFLHTHTFTMANADWDTVFAQRPMTFEIFRDVTSSQQYAGCNIAGLSMNVAPNQALQVTASIVGKSMLQLQKTTASFPGSPANPLAFDTCSIEVGGAATALIEGITSNIDNQLEGVPSLNNSTTIRAIRRTGPQMFRLSGNIAFEDITEMENFRNQTEQQFIISMTRANSFQFIQDFPRVVYNTFAPVMAGRDRIIVGFEGIARYHSGSANAGTFKVTNNTSGY